MPAPVNCVAVRWLLFTFIADIVAASSVNPFPDNQKLYLVDVSGRPLSQSTALMIGEVLETDYNGITIYDVETGTAYKTARAPSTLMCPNAAISDNIVYVIGLARHSNKSFSVFSYNLTSDTWLELPPVPNRLDHALLIHRTWLIYITRASDLFLYNRTEPRPSEPQFWTQVIGDDRNYYAALYASFVSVDPTGIDKGSFIFMSGGIEEVLQLPYADKRTTQVKSKKAWRTSDLGRTWQSLAPMHDARACHQLVNIDQAFIHALGGSCSDEYYNIVSSMETYSIADGTWRLGPSMLYARIRFGVAVIPSTRDVLVCGDAADQPHLYVSWQFDSECEIYNAAANSWTLPNWQRYTDASGLWLRTTKFHRRALDQSLEARAQHRPNMFLVTKIPAAVRHSREFKCQQCFPTELNNFCRRDDKSFYNINRWTLVPCNDGACMVVYGYMHFLLPNGSSSSLSSSSRHRVEPFELNMCVSCARKYYTEEIFGFAFKKEMGTSHSCKSMENELHNYPGPYKSLFNQTIWLDYFSDDLQRDQEDVPVRSSISDHQLSTPISKMRVWVCVGSFR